jgi:hypothetical protein
MCRTFIRATWTSGTRSAKKKAILPAKVWFQHLHGALGRHSLALAHAHHFAGVFEQNGTGLKAGDQALPLRPIQRQPFHRPKPLLEAMSRAAAFAGHGEGLGVGEEGRNAVHPRLAVRELPVVGDVRRGGLQHEQVGNKPGVESIQGGFEFEVALRQDKPAATQGGGGFEGTEGAVLASCAMPCAPSGGCKASFSDGTSRSAIWRSSNPSLFRRKSTCATNSSSPIWWTNHCKAGLRNPAVILKPKIVVATSGGTGKKGCGVVRPGT